MLSSSTSLLNSSRSQRQVVVCACARALSCIVCPNSGQYPCSNFQWSQTRRAGSNVTTRTTDLSGQNNHGILFGNWNRSLVCSTHTSAISVPPLPFTAAYLLLPHSWLLFLLLPALFVSFSFPLAIVLSLCLSVMFEYLFGIRNPDCCVKMRKLMLECVRER
jgi:hypothetical protein